jgi:hypothetical protein
MPAKAGILKRFAEHWIPACAGMTRIEINALSKGRSEIRA